VRLQGTGAIGLVCAALGAHVVLTDLPEVLPLLQHNVQRSAVAVREAGGSCTVLPFTWGSSADLAQLDGRWCHAVYWLWQSHASLSSAAAAAASYPRANRFYVAAVPCVVILVLHTADINIV
jgi:hypothetical protein